MLCAKAGVTLPFPHDSQVPKLELINLSKKCPEIILLLVQSKSKLRGGR